MRKRDLRAALGAVREKLGEVTTEARAYAFDGELDVDVTPVVVGMKVMADYVVGMLDGEVPAVADQSRVMRALVGAWLNEMADRGLLGGGDDGDE